MGVSSSILPGRSSLRGDHEQRSAFLFFSAPSEFRSLLELKSIHYVKSMKIFTRLTSGTSYIQPPVIIIEYAELTQSDLGQGSTVQINFQTEYQMDLSNQIRDIWIAVGVLSGLGVILAFIQTRIWYSRAGKQVVDLAVSESSARLTSTDLSLFSDHR